MAYEELSLIGFINEFKNASTGPHPRRFCFVLGAGASRTSGIKSGQELVNIWEKELVERNKSEHEQWKNEMQISDKNRAQFYSQYYERRFRRHPEDGYNYLEKIMEQAKPSVGYVMLAHILTNTIHNVVITTNFDHLTEDTITYYENKIPLVVGHESLAHYITRQKQIVRPTIVKIHRDLLYDPKSKATELQVLHDDWAKALIKIFEEYHPVFIGYAGNDRTLMDFLMMHKEKFQNNEWLCPYWTFYKSEEINDVVKSFLVHANGYSIRHDGFDKVMYLLGASVDYKIPNKEEFIKSAEKRYFDISDVIDGFSEEEKEMMKSYDNRQTGAFKEWEKPNKQHQDTTESDSENEQIEQIMKSAIRQVTEYSDLQRMYSESNMLAKEGNFEDAEKICKELTQISPSNPRYHYGYANILVSLGRLEEAKREIMYALDLDPKNSWYHYILADILRELKEYDYAKEELQKAVEFHPDDAWYRYALGDILRELKEFDDAREELQKAVELASDDAFYHYILGDILREQQEYDCAKEELQKAVEIEPDDAWYHCVLGNVLFELNEIDEAKEEFQKSVELDSDDAFYHYKFGTILSELKEFDNAKEELQKAVELDPDNEVISYKLNEILDMIENQ